MRTLAGILTIRNGFRLDYCFEECARSLLNVCDELVIGDVMSDDGTWEAVQQWAAVNSKITLCRTEWSDPVNNPNWWPDVLNRTREHAKSQHIIHLDADEIIHEADYPAIRQAADEGKTLFLKRLNFWKDAQHLIPEGVCCGTKVLRMAPSNMPVPSDYPYSPAEATVAQAVESDIRVFHYGFLRKREAFFQKARAVARIWYGGYDERLERAEKAEGNWADHAETGWEHRLVDYAGSHPAIIHQWLKDRNYDPR